MSDERDRNEAGRNIDRNIDHVEHVERASDDVEGHALAEKNIDRNVDEETERASDDVEGHVLHPKNSDG